MRAETVKNNIIKVCMDAQTLQLLEKARDYVHLDKSKFIRQCIQEKAKEIIAEYESTHFNQRTGHYLFQCWIIHLNPQNG